MKILIAVDEWFIETGTVHKKRDRRFNNSSVELVTIYIIAIKKYLGNSRITQKCYIAINFFQVLEKYDTVTSIIRTAKEEMFH